MLRYAEYRYTSTSLSASSATHFGWLNDRSATEESGSVRAVRALPRWWILGTKRIVYKDSQDVEILYLK